ncbi:MAG: response regulator transcription factor [Paraclostridium sp.]
MSILVISDSFVIRDGVGSLLKEILNTDKLKLFSSIEEVKYKNLNKLEFVFVDIKKDDIHKLVEIYEIKNKLENVKVMILDTSKDKDILIKSVEYDFESYITSLADKEDLIYIIKKLSKGHRFYDSDLTKVILCNINKSGIEILTDREKEVLFKIADGFNNRDIADKLNITEYTVKKHVSSILSKLNLKSRKDAIIYVKDNLILDAI